MFAAAICAAFFFLVWGVLRDNGEQAPWIASGISASILLCGAVVLREVLLRRARNRFIRQQRRIDDRVFDAHYHLGESRSQNKLTLERNAAFLREIKQKSGAAMVLSKFSAGHREVFELCSAYLELTTRELKIISASSPRFEPLLKGRTRAAEFHRFHMLKWAEIESRSLANAAQSSGREVERIESAQKALRIIEAALGSYPSEPSLLGSKELLNDMIVSIEVSHWIKQAETAAASGDHMEAKSLYRDALFYLGRDNVHSEERERAAMLIRAEIDKIRMMEGEDD